MHHLTIFPMVAELYGAAPDDLRVSPLLAPSFARLPPTFFQVNELDPLRDDGVVYEKRLREERIPTKLILYVISRCPHAASGMLLTSMCCRYHGVGHGFHYTSPDTDTAKKLDHDAREGLRWLLSLVKTH